MKPRLLVELGLLVGCLLGAGLTMPSSGAAGVCSDGDPPTAHLLPIPAVIARDGGLLVRGAMELGSRSDPAFHVGPNGRLVLRAGHFLVAGRQVAARLVPLARGLARLSPAESVEGDAFWVGDRGPVALRFAARAATLTSAPDVSQAALHVRRSRSNGEDVDVTYRLEVVMRREAPPEAMAILVFEDGANVAVSYTQISSPSGRRIDVASGGSCDTFGWPFGWPSPGGLVRVAFVDDSGRLSPLSQPVRLR